MHVDSFAAMTSSPRGTRSSSLIISWARRRSCKNLLGVFAEDLSRGRQRDPGSKPFKERTVEFLLELPHLGADGRLGTIAGLRSFGKAFEPDDLQKGVKLVEIHGGPQRLLKRRRVATIRALIITSGDMSDF